MKSRIVILALVGLTAGVAGTVGSRIVAGSDAPAAAAQPATQEIRKVAQKKSTDGCQKVARRVSRTAMSDAQLKKLLKKNRECRAVVIDAKAPGMASSSAPNVVTLPAIAPAPSTVVSASDDQFENEDGNYDDEHEYEAEDGFEEEGD